MGVNSPFGCFEEVAFPLHYAAKSLSAELVQLFLSHGARTDIKLHDTRGMRGHHGLLPLEIALDVAREQYGSEQIVFSPKPSIIQLIASLCNPGIVSFSSKIFELKELLLPQPLCMKHGYFKTRVVLVSFSY